MISFKSILAAATVALSLTATSAFAVTVIPFATPLSANSATLGLAEANAFEDFGMTSLVTEFDEDLEVAGSIVIDPYRLDLGGNPANSIGVSWSLNGGATTSLVIQSNGTASFAPLEVDADDLLTFFVTGVAGQSGNRVNFIITTSEIVAAPVPLPAGGLLLLTGIAGVAAFKRRKKHAA